MCVVWSWWQQRRPDCIPRDREPWCVRSVQRNRLKGIFHVHRHMIPQAIPQHFLNFLMLFFILVSFSTRPIRIYSALRPITMHTKRAQRAKKMCSVNDFERSWLVVMAMGKSLNTHKQIEQKQFPINYLRQCFGSNSILRSIYVRVCWTPQGNLERHNMVATIQKQGARSKVCATTRIDVIDTISRIIVGPHRWQCVLVDNFV